MENIELFQDRPRTEDDTLQRTLSRHDRHARLVNEALIETAEEGSAACHHDAAFHDIGSEFGRCLVEGVLDGIDERFNRLLDRLSDLLAGEDDSLREPGDQVAARGLPQPVRRRTARLIQWPSSPARRSFRRA